MPRIAGFRELKVYQNAFQAAMMIFEITKSFPQEEKYSLTDQIRRSSRSVCSNIAESWRKRKYPAHFVSKLSDSAGEADETRVWLDFSLKSRYINEKTYEDMDDRYDHILGQLTKMMSEPDNWKIK